MSVLQSESAIPPLHVDKTGKSTLDVVDETSYISKDDTRLTMSRRIKIKEGVYAC